MIEVKIVRLDALPNTNTVQNQHAKSLVFFLRHHLTGLDTIKVTNFTIHVRKQTSFFLRAAVQGLYHPLPGRRNNFLFETGAPRKGSYSGIE